MLLFDGLFIAAASMIPGLIWKCGLGEGENKRKIKEKRKDKPSEPRARQRSERRESQRVLDTS